MEQNGWVDVTSAALDGCQNALGRDPFIAGLFRDFDDGAAFPISHTFKACISGLWK